MHTVVNKYTEFVENLLAYRKPVYLLQDGADMHNPSWGVRTCHQSGSTVLEPLQFVELMLGGSGKECVAVVQSRDN